MEPTRNHRKVYARGFFDGVRATENTMTPRKQRQKLEGQTAVAKKVYEAVPITEWWSMHQIGDELRRKAHTTTTFDVLQGCLRALTDTGLVTEDTLGKFRRVEVREPAPAQTKSEAEMLDPSRPIPQIIIPEPKAKKDKPSMPAASPAPRAPAADTSKTPLEILADLSGRLSRVIADVNAIASDLETAAIVIQDGIAAHEQDLEQLRQFKALLRTFQS